MDATQAISDSILESDEEENEQENQNNRGLSPAKLCILENEHIPKTEIPLYLGDNVLGRDHSCSSAHLSAPSISKQHATISIIVHGKQKLSLEALIWDLGSLNGTRKGRLKLTPHVRYAISEGDSLVVADIPCQFIICHDVFKSLQGSAKNSGNQGLERRAQLSDPTLRKEGNASQECVRESSSAVVFENVKNTPVGNRCLALEKTPNQPQEILVPESDSDSEGDSHIPQDARRRACVSDSDSHLSSPNSATFLSPANKIVPESEDEMSTTPASANGSRSNVRFGKDNSDANVGQQQLKNPLEIADDSEEEGATPDQSALKENSKSIPEIKEDITDPGQKELSVDSEGMKAGFEIPAFNMDSDTDIEGEEEGATSAVPVVSLETPNLSNTDSYHLDSDTDVENTADDVSSSAEKKPPESALLPQAAGFSLDSDTDIEGEEESATSAVPVVSLETPNLSNTDSYHLDSDTDVENTADDVSSSTEKKPPGSALLPQAAGFSLDSDTDVDDEVSESAAKAEAVRAGVAESAPSAQQKDFHLDSDTDVDDEEDKKCESGVSIPQGLHLNSDTDDEVSHDPSASASFVKESVVGNSITQPPGIASENTGGASANQADSDADTDVSEAPNARGSTNFGLDSDTDVEMDSEVVKRNPISSSHGNTDLHLQSCSTPVQLSGNDATTATQPFLMPRTCAAGSDVKPLSAGSDSFDDEDFVVAETQSFVLAGRVCPRRLPKDISSEPTQAFVLESSVEESDTHLSGDEESFKLGLSESSHLRNQADAIALESTQPFGAANGSVSQEDTQVYSAEDIATTSDPNLEDVQTDEHEQGSSLCPVLLRGSGVDLEMLETQAFVLEHSDFEDRSEEVHHENPTSSLAMAMAETQPMCAVEEEDSSESDNPDQTNGSEKSAKLAETTGTSPRPCGEGPSVADVKTSEEDAPSVSHKTEANLLQKTSQALGIPDTQPVNTNTDSEDEDSMPLFRKRKSKPLQPEDESPSLNISDTQPVSTVGDSDEERSMLIFRKRKAKPLQLEDDSQPMSDLASGDIQPGVPDTQPIQTNTDEENETGIILGKSRAKRNRTENGDKESGVRSARAPPKGRGSRLRRAKKDNTDVHLAETQPITTHEDDHSEDEKVIPCTDHISAADEKSADGKLEEESNIESHRSSVTSRPSRRKNTLRNEMGEEEQPGPSNRRSRVTRVKSLEDAESSGSAKMDAKDCKGARSRRAKLSSVETEDEKPEMSQVRQSKRKKTNKRQQAEEEEEMEEMNTDKERSPEQGSLQAERSLEELEQERAGKEKLEQELVQAQKLEQERMEKERQEKLQQELAENERARLEKLEEERLEEERQEKLEQERLHAEQAERERLRLEKLEEERIEKEREEKLQQELAEKERLKLEKMEEERIEKERQEKLQQELAEKERLEQLKIERERQEELEQTEQALKREEKKNAESGVRGRRAARRTVTRSKDSEQDLACARVTRSRSRSNSSNSVTSETSTSSVNTQASRGRARGAKGPVQTTIPSYTSRRRTVAAPTEQDSDIPAPAVISRSNSSTSLNSEVSNSSSSVSQNRGGGGGGRVRGRGRKSTPLTNSCDSVSGQGDGGSTAKSRGRGRRTLSRAVEMPEPTLSTSRGKRLASAKEPTAQEEQDPSVSEGPSSTKSSLPSSRTIRGRSLKIKTEATEALVASEVADEGQDKRRGRKREFPESSTTVIEEAQGENLAPTQAKRRGRQSNVPANKTTKGTPSAIEVKEEMGTESAVQRRGKGRTQEVQKQENMDESSGSSELSLPQTPVSQTSRKRQAPVKSSPVPRTPRSSAASPAGSRLGPSYKVLYTGVVDEAGEKVLTRLGGSMAKGVADMNCLVTDKVRRTVKFLCAVAKGIPVVTTNWLEKSGKAGSFLEPGAFIVKDPEQEKKFNFSLAESLRVASNQPLLQGFEIHITKSVKPEPVHMKDILSCSGATFLPKMPSSRKPRTIVISCEDDSQLCAPAFSASIPVVSAEFILSGILQQKVDLETHKLCAPAASLPAAGGRGKARKKS
ncbi:mediator of DNA damage checkpoint protein 1 [Synchiropus splendidus]|uniref:mediator of DNA damage checkpoint protein 1 n=1 Tax=Synchiropus splendidus TaxID=270530 RepID=UPI00237DD72B|nr:mediator of DNA damage checkpoint protein 1 [Synchiropus splendidus]XP_053736398.1 mediator of DNA damage checkpoint protein 1 [Synchiropus splendidus]